MDDNEFVPHIHLYNLLLAQKSDRLPKAIQTLLFHL